MPMAWETGVQSQVESYQRLKKWYLMPPCLTLSIMRYISRVKWSTPGKGVAPSLTPRCSSYWKGSLWIALDYSCQPYLLTLLSTAVFLESRFLCFSVENIKSLKLSKLLTKLMSYLVSISLLFFLFFLKNKQTWACKYGCVHLAYHLLLLLWRIARSRVTFLRPQCLLRMLSSYFQFIIIFSIAFDINSTPAGIFVKDKSGKFVLA